VVCVGVVCGSDLFTGICVLYCTLYLVTHFFVCAYHIFLFSARESARCTCVIHCVCSIYKEIYTFIKLVCHVC